METTRIHPLNNLTYETMLKPKWRMDSLLRLAGLISKKEAKKIIEISKRSRLKWR